MPNWCYNTYTITGSEEEIESFKEVLDNLNSLDKPLVENGFGKLWLGCVVTSLGEDWNKIGCRGHITDYMLNNECSMTLYTETAWAETPEVRHLIEQKYPSFRILYVSQESGMCEFYTNDIDYAQNYYVDYYIDGDSECDDYCEEDVIDKVNELLGSNCKTIEDALAVVENFVHEDEDEYINIYQYQYCDD